MTQVQCIRDMFFRQGKTQAEIARILKVDRKTIRKYLDQDNFNQETPPLRERSSLCPKLDPFKALIQQWLEEDTLRKNRKQRHTAQRIFGRLREQHQKDHPGENFPCSYRTVASYVAYLKHEKQLSLGKSPGYLPLVHPPGEAQADFGKASIIEKGQEIPVYYLNLVFPYSNVGYVQVFKGENLECLIEGMQNIFHHVGGVPRKLWVDNASSMVRHILQEGKRECTEKFIRFQEHMGFEVSFCNPACGHEKGSVENKVGYHRRNWLVPPPEIADLLLYNQELLRQLDQDQQREHYLKGASLTSLFQQDQEALLPLPRERFEGSRWITVRADRYGKCTLHQGKHRYSTSPVWAEQTLFAQLTAYEVLFRDEQHRLIVKHPRLYGNHPQEQMDWIPYLQRLARCPTALKYTGIYEMLPLPLQEHLTSLPRSERSRLLKVLHEFTEGSDFDTACQQVTDALHQGIQDPEGLKMYHRKQCHEWTEQVIPLQAHIPQSPSFAARVSCYDELMASCVSVEEQRCKKN